MIGSAIWAELENANAPGAWSKVKRRVGAGTDLDLFVAVAKPSNERMLLMAVGAASVDEVDDLPASKGVAVRVVRPGEDGADASVEVVLHDPRAEDIFTSLVNDVVDAASDAADERSAVEALLARLDRWQRFLELAGPEGLSSERQRGLYGELLLIRDHLLRALTPGAALRAWKGPEAASHDFHLGPAAIEVKTTAAKQHQVLRIASERQLDPTGVDRLFVFHLSVDTHLDTGETLNAIVDDLRVRFDGTAAQPALREGLLAAGYFEGHRALYDAAGYTVREWNFFEVGAGFPRIVESDLPPGVGDVRYSIAVSECRHHAVPERIVLEFVGVAHDE